MKNKRRKRFHKLFAKLPPHIQKQAIEDFKLFKEDPYHSSLGFKVIEGDITICAVDIGYHYRALGEKIGDTIEWYWIGSHQDYDKLI
jgi:hypothetical protein